MAAKPAKPAKADKAPKTPKAEKAPKAVKPAKAEKKPTPKPKKRPEIAYIQVFFKDRLPLIIDPTKDCMFVWGEEGYEVLKAFYAGKGEKKKVVETEKIWHTPITPAVEGRAGDPEDPEYPAGLTKSVGCDPEGRP